MKLSRFVGSKTSSFAVDSGLVGASSTATGSGSASFYPFLPALAPGLVLAAFFAAS